MDTADLIFETRQDPEDVKRVLEKSGNTNFTIETAGDVPPDPDAPLEEEAPPVAEATPAAEPAPAAPVAAHEKRPSSGYKKKWEAQSAENERLRQELERSKAAPPVAAAAAPPVADPAKPAAVADLVKPDPEKYENSVYDPQYIEDMADYTYEKRRRKEREEEAAAVATKQATDLQASQTRDQEALIAWQKDQIAQSKARHEDFDAVIATDHGKPVCNTVMEAELKSRDDGSELAYWLASHPDDANRICQLTAMREGETAVDFRRKLKLAQKELDKIELPDLTAEEPAEQEEEEAVDAAPVVAPPAPKPPAAAPPRSPAPPKASKPAPPSPVGQRGGSPKKRLSQMSTEELRSLDTEAYRKLRKEEFGK